MARQKGDAPFASTRRFFKYLPSGQLCCFFWCFAFALTCKQIGLRCSGISTEKRTEPCRHPAFTPTCDKSCICGVEVKDGHALWVTSLHRDREGAGNQHLEMFSGALRLGEADGVNMGLNIPNISVAAWLLSSWWYICLHLFGHLKTQLCGEIGRLNSQPGRARDYKTAWHPAVNQNETKWNMKHFIPITLIIKCETKVFRGGICSIDKCVFIYFTPCFQP